MSLPCNRTFYAVLNGVYAATAQASLSHRSGTLHNPQTEAEGVIAPESTGRDRLLSDDYHTAAHALSVFYQSFH